jgi:Sulfatase
MGSVAAVATLPGFIPHVHAASGNRPPNFIIILADDQGYQDVGCYDSPQIKTPNLDRMAKEGVRFTSFYMVGARKRRRLRAALARW